MMNCDGRKCLTITGNYIFRGLNMDSFSKSLEVNKSVSFDGIAYECLVFVQAAVSLCSDDVMNLSCANVKCEVAHVNIWIPTDFRVLKRVSIEYNHS